MSLERLVAVLLVRRRRVFFSVLLLGLAASVAVTFSLPKRYDATATLFLAENRPVTVGVASNVDEALTRSYGELLTTPMVAAEAARSLPFPTSAGEISGAVDVKVVTGTRLIEITATDGDPERAATIANTYAELFVRNRRKVAAESADEQLAQLRREIGVLAERRADAARDRGARAARLSQIDAELDAARRSYSTISESSAVEAKRVSVSSPASVPGSPSRPRPVLYLLLGGLLSLVLAAIAAFARDALDRRVQSEAELVDLFGAPVLARIPLSNSFDVDADPSLREAFGFLRTNLRSIAPDAVATRIAVTGPLPKVGKSTITSELCRALAAAGERVVAVECDLRKPRLAELLADSRPRAGMVDLLSGGGDAGELVVRGKNGVRVLPPGDPAGADVSSLFIAPALDRVLRELQHDADRLVLDTPPVLAAPETSVACTLADGVLLVVDMHSMRRDQLEEAHAQLARAGARVLGLVLNRHRGKTTGYGYYSSQPVRPKDWPAPEDVPAAEPARG